MPKIFMLAVTGSRPDKLPDRFTGYDRTNPTRTRSREYFAAYLDHVKERGYEPIVITGMALGFDQDAADVCIEKGVQFYAYIPCLGQEQTWPESSQDYYKEILKHAAKVVFISEKSYDKDCMQRRNEAMVDSCIRLYAATDGTAGGSMNCVKYAKSVGKPITIYNPRTCAIHYIDTVKEGE